MKKWMALLLAALMLLVTACSKNDNAGKNAGSGDGSAPADNNAFKVVLLIPGTLGDKSFFDAANAGLTQVKEQLGATTKVIEMGADQTKWEPADLQRRRRPGLGRHHLRRLANHGAVERHRRKKSGQNVYQL